MGQAVIDGNHLRHGRIPEVEEKEREVNGCRTLIGLDSDDMGLR